MITGDGASTVAELVLLLTFSAEVLFVPSELTLTVGCGVSVSLEPTLLAETGDPSLVTDKDPVM